MESCVEVKNRPFKECLFSKHWLKRKMFLAKI